MGDNPAVWCSNHIAPFEKVNEEIDHDGTQTLVTQHWRAACGCAVEITLAIPDQGRVN